MSRVDEVVGKPKSFYYAQVCRMMSVVQPCGLCRTGVMGVSYIGGDRSRPSKVAENGYMW